MFHYQRVLPMKKRPRQAPMSLETADPKSMTDHSSIERHQLREGQVLYTNTQDTKEAGAKGPAPRKGKDEMRRETSG